MKAAIRAEWRKLTRSTVTRTATLLMVAVLPAMALGFYEVAIGGGTGAIAQKATAFVVAEGWGGYLGLVDQVAAVAVFLGAGIVSGWVFGREHVDGTFESLFALPVSRGSIAGAKFVVLGMWSTALSVLIAVVALALGLVAQVEPVGSGSIGEGLLRLLVVAGLTCSLAATAGFVASVGRGYLPSIGAIILIVASAQIAVLFGTGAWFPFAVPGLLAVAGTDGVPDVSVVQAALVPLLSGGAIWATIWWWRHAEVV